MTRTPSPSRKLSGGCEWFSWRQPGSQTRTIHASCHSAHGKWTAVYSCLALRQLLTAVRLEQVAIEELGLDPSVNQELQTARLRFQKELPGIQDMRDALTHFDEWSRGLGRGPQKALRDKGHTVREVARLHWGFGYEPGSHTVRLGPHRFAVETATQAAAELCASIYAAAHQVDVRRAAGSAMKEGDSPGPNAAV